MRSIGFVGFTFQLPLVFDLFCLSCKSCPIWNSPFLFVMILLILLNCCQLVENVSMLKSWSNLLLFLILTRRDSIQKKKILMGFLLNYLLISDFPVFGRIGLCDALVP